LFSDGGSVVDVASWTRVAHLPVSGLLCVDPTQSRTYVVSAQSASTYALYAFSAANYHKLWSYSLPQLRGSPLALISCKPGVLALLGSDSQLLVLNTALMPAEPVADLAVGLKRTSPPVDLGTPISYRVTVTNQGPDSARGVVVTNVPLQGAHIL